MRARGPRARHAPDGTGAARRRAIARLAALALAPGLLAACASPGAYATPPRVSLVGLRPVDIRLLEQRYRVRLRVQNPNADALHIRGMDYTIDVNGQRFASGVSAQPITLPAFGERVVEVDVSSTLARIVEQLRALEESGQPRIRYRIAGTIALEGVPGPVPFSYEDAIDLGSERPQRRPRTEGSI